MHYYKYYFLLFLSVTSVLPLLAQEKALILDSTNSLQVFSLDTNTIEKIPKVKKHSITKAVVFSSIIPGLGQVYNKKYWKVPIIYGGIGVATYFALQERKNFTRYKEAYISRFTGDQTDDLLPEFNTETLNQLQGTARSSMENYYVLAGLIYILNIVDASVDAHMYHFDVSDDLSLQLFEETPIYNTFTTQAIPLFNLRLSF